MRINNLKMKDFRSVKTMNFDFATGFNLVIGENGSGKSSSFQALAYLLLDVTEKKISDNIRWGQKKFELDLSISHENKEYIIKYDKKKIVDIDGEIYEGRDANIRLAEDFEPSLCKASILAMQGEADVISATPSQRRDILKKIYDLDFSNEVNSLNDQQKHIEENSLDLVSKEIYALENKDYRIKELLEGEITREEFDIAVKDKKELEDVIKVTKEAIVKWDAKQVNLEKLYKSDRTLKELQEALIKDEEVAVYNLKLRNEQKLAIETEIKNYDDIKFLEVDKLKAEKKAISLVRVSRFDDTRLIELEEKFIEIGNKLHSLIERIILVEKGKCPTCGSEFESNELASLNEKREALDKEKKELTLAIANEKILKKDYEKAIQENTAKTSKIELLETKIKLEEEKSSRHLEALQHSRNEIELEIVGMTTSIEANKVKLATYQKEKSKLDTEIFELEKAEPQSQPVLDKVMTDRIAEIETIFSEFKRIADINAEITKDNKVIEIEKKADKKILKDKINEKDNLIMEVEVLKRAKIFYNKDFPNYVISKIIKGIEVGMNDFLVKTYGGRYEIAIEENKTGIEILYGEHKAPVSLASGAEKDLFNIGMKLAYNKLSGLKVLLLDEPDHMMSLDIAQEVFSAINNEIKLGNLNQVFIITHKDTIKEMIENEFHAKVFQVKDGILI